MMDRTATEEAATRAMAILTKDAAAKGLTKKSLLIPTPYCGKGGIKSFELVSKN
jgi:E3 ubiquitin-protein ligase SHPRH